MRAIRRVYDSSIQHSEAMGWMFAFGCYLIIVGTRQAIASRYEFVHDYQQELERRVQHTNRDELVHAWMQELLRNARSEGSERVGEREYGTSRRKDDHAVCCRWIRLHFPTLFSQHSLRVYAHCTPWFCVGFLLSIPPYAKSFLRNPRFLVLADFFPWFLKTKYLIAWFSWICLHLK